jgi:hypothetical protein
MKRYTRERLGLVIRCAARRQRRYWTQSGRRESKRAAGNQPFCYPKRILLAAEAQPETENTGGHHGPGGRFRNRRCTGPLKIIDSEGVEFIASPRDVDAGNARDIGRYGLP